MHSFRWFQKFDANVSEIFQPEALSCCCRATRPQASVLNKPCCAQGDGRFQRDELRQLLNFLYPQAEASEERIDELVERATRMESSSLTLPGNKNGSVSRSDLFATVMRYRDHLSEQATLDVFFESYDTVGSPPLPML